MDRLIRRVGSDDRAPAPRAVAAPRWRVVLCCFSYVCAFASTHVGVQNQAGRERGHAGRDGVRAPPPALRVSGGPSRGPSEGIGAHGAYVGDRLFC